MLWEIMSEVMKEMSRMTVAKAAATATQAAITTAQSAQRIWTNVVIAGVYCQVPTSNTGEPYMVIPAKHNRETLVYPNPDITLPSNNTLDKIIETINRMFRNNKAITI